MDALLTETEINTVENLKTWKRLVRKVLISPVHSMLIWATCFNMIFCYVVYYSNYMKNLSPMLLIIVILPLLVTAYITILIGALRMCSRKLASGIVVLAIGLVLAALLCVVESAQFVDDKVLKEFETFRILSFSIQICFIFAWMVVMVGAAFLSKVFWHNRVNTTETQTTWSDFVYKILLPGASVATWREKPMSPFKLYSTVGLSVVHVVYQGGSLAVLADITSGYENFNENKWVMLVVAAYVASIAAYSLHTFGFMVRDEVTLFASACFFIFSICLALASWAVLYFTFNSFQPTKEMYYFTIGSSLNASYSIISSNIFTAVFTLDLALKLKSRPKYTSLGQAVLTIRKRF